MCIHASGTTDTTTVYTWTMCVSSEQLYVYSCKWNYRHDHCIYMDYVCVFRATVYVFMQVELQTRPLYIHGLCVCLQSNCMCIHASGTTDTTTVYTWTMCVFRATVCVFMQVELQTRPLYIHGRVYGSQGDRSVHPSWMSSNLPQQQRTSIPSHLCCHGTGMTCVVMTYFCLQASEDIYQLPLVIVQNVHLHVSVSSLECLLPSRISHLPGHQNSTSVLVFSFTASFVMWSSTSAMYCHLTIY